VTQDQLDLIIEAIARMRKDLEDDHLDLVRRSERIEATLIDLGNRMSSVEQAVIRLFNALPLRAA